MIENKLLPRHFFGGYIFDIARRDPCRSLKLFESLVEALLALELQAFCESVPGISQFVFRWIAAGRGGRTLRTGQQQGVRLVRAEAKCCERQHRGKQYPQTHAQIVTGNSDEKEISIGRVYLRVYVGTGGHELEFFRLNPLSLERIRPFVLHGHVGNFTGFGVLKLVATARVFFPLCAATTQNKEMSEVPCPA